MAEKESEVSKWRWPFPPMGRAVLLFSGIAFCLLILFPFWGSIAVAAIFALGLSEPLSKLRSKLGVGKKMIAGIGLATVSIVLMVPISAFVVRLYQIFANSRESGVQGLLSPGTINRISGAYNSLEQLITRYGVLARVYNSTAEGRDQIRQNAMEFVSGAFKYVSATLTSLPEWFLSLFTFGLFFYLFLSKGIAIKKWLASSNVIPEQDLEQLTKVMKASCYDVIVSNFVIGLIQASIITGGSYFCGYEEWVLIFATVFLLSYIPFIGAAPVALVLALLSLLNNQIGEAIALAVIATIAGTVDNIIRPYLLAHGEHEVHPVLSFAGIIGAIAILGLKGIFIGPAILLTTSGILFAPQLKEKNSKEVPKKLHEVLRNRTTRILQRPRKTS